MQVRKSLTSEAAPSATQFLKRSYKISNNPGLQDASLDALPTLQTGQKLGIILPFEVVLKLKLPKNHFNKKHAPKI